MATRRLSRKTLQAIRRYGPSVADVAQQYGISGEALLAKLVVGESGDNPKAISGAGAKGRTQFMPGSRDIAVQKYGVDPWRSADEAVHAAALHLQGKINGSKGLEGYNPGSPTYTSYILGQQVGNVRGTGAAPSVSAGTQTTSQRVLKSAAVDRSGERRAAVGSFLQQGGVGNSAAVLNLAQTYGQLKDTPATYGTKTTTTQPKVKAQDGPEVSALASAATERADAINAQGLPYQWGGGHAGKTKLHDAVPLDCSGAVSKVLGIDPRVSGDFEKWGRSGDGGNKGVTIYSNEKHVLMKINGKFFGTSASNPGGGAGWIPRAQVTDDYLAGFTARHSKR